MITTEMLAQLRLNTLLEDGAADYTDTVLLREMSDSLATKFQDMIIGFRNGTWQQSYLQPVTTGVPIYRLPAQVTVLGKIEIGYGSGAAVDAINFVRLEKVDEGHADLFQRSYNGLGQPQAYVLRGNAITLLPTPDNSAYVLRVTYYRRVPRLTPDQNVESVNDRGRITAVNTATRVITVNSYPIDYGQPVPANIHPSGTNIDIVKPDGWYDHGLSNAAWSNTSATTITVFGVDPMYDVKVGDYVRAYGQSDWPMLPEDFHRCVVDIASVKILIQRGYQQKAANFAADVTADLQRFETLYSNRTREEPRKIRAALTDLRRWRLGR